MAENELKVILKSKELAEHTLRITWKTKGDLVNNVKNQRFKR